MTKNDKIAFLSAILMISIAFVGIYLMSIPLMFLAFIIGCVAFAITGFDP